MAGEWIPVDCNLGTKPEVLELVDVTGEPVEVVGWRLLQLWAWAAMNTADGHVVATPGRLAAVAGGDEAFWLAVQRVGWIEFHGSVMTIVGWEKRFSKSAKARLEDARRKAAGRVVRKLSESCPEVSGHLSGKCPEVVQDLSEICPESRGLEERRGEESTRQDNSSLRSERELSLRSSSATSETPKRRSRSSPPDSMSWSASAGWSGITDADRAAWRTAYPAVDLAAELAKMGEWLKATPEKARKSRWRAFVIRWLSRSQDRGGSGSGPRLDAPRRPVVSSRVWRDDALANMTDEQYREWRGRNPQAIKQGP